MSAPMSLPQHMIPQQRQPQPHEVPSPTQRQNPNGRGPQPDAGPSGSPWDGNAPSSGRISSLSDQGYAQPGPPIPQGNFSVPYGQGAYYQGHPGPAAGPSHASIPGQPQAYAPYPLPLDHQLSQLQNQVYEEFHLRLYPLLRQHGDLIRDLDSRLYASETRAAAGVERIKELEAKVAELQGVRAPIPPPIAAPAPVPAPAPAPQPVASSSTSGLKRKKTAQSSSSGKKGAKPRLRDAIPPPVWDAVQTQVRAATQHLYGVPRPYPYWHDLAPGEEWPRLINPDGSEGIKAIRFDFDETTSGPRNHAAFRTIVKYIVDNKHLHPAGLQMGPGSLVQAKGILLEAAHAHFEELKDSW